MAVATENDVEATTEHPYTQVIAHLPVDIQEATLELIVNETRGYKSVQKALDRYVHYTNRSKSAVEDITRIITRREGTGKTAQSALTLARKRAVGYLKWLTDAELDEQADKFSIDVTTISGDDYDETRENIIKAIVEAMYPNRD